MRRPILFLTALLVLSACDSDVEIRKAVVSSAEQPDRAAGPVNARPSGPARSVSPTTSAILQGAASVTAVQPLNDHGYSAKLLNLVGGDPAANGNQLWLAFFVSPAEGWTMFMIGDFASWELVEEGAQGLIFDITQDVVGDDGNIVRGPTERLIVNYAPGGPEATAPATITVTPAVNEPAPHGRLTTAT
jgi:hypothetical protein